MATRAQAEALLALLSRPEAPPRAPAAPHRAPHPRDAVETLLLRQAALEEELAAARRFVLGEQQPLRLLRGYAGQNVQLLRAARRALRRQCRLEAAMLIQLRARDAMAAARRRRASRRRGKARARWSMLSSAIRRVPLERKVRLLRRRLCRQLEWCEEQRGKLHREARAVYGSTAAQLLRRMHQLNRQLRASPYERVTELGLDIRTLSQKHPIYKYVRGAYEELLQLKGQLEAAGCCLLRIYGVDLPKQEPPPVLPPAYSAGDIPQTIVSGVMHASLAQLSKKHRTLNSDIAFASAHAAFPIPLNILTQLARSMDDASCAFSLPSLSLPDLEDIVAQSEAARAARERALEIAIEMGGLTRSDVQELRKEPKSSWLSKGESRALLEAESRKRQHRLKAAIAEVHAKEEEGMAALLRHAPRVHARGAQAVARTEAQLHRLSKSPPGSSCGSGTGASADVPPLASRPSHHSIPRPGRPSPDFSREVEPHESGVAPRPNSAHSRETALMIASINSTLEEVNRSIKLREARTQQAVQAAAEACDPQGWRGAAAQGEGGDGTQDEGEGGTPAEGSEGIQEEGCGGTQGEGVVAKARKQLEKAVERLVLLLVEWDEDESGTVNAAEFRKALPLLELRLPREVADTLFREVAGDDPEVDHWALFRKLCAGRREEEVAAAEARVRAEVAAAATARKTSEESDVWMRACAGKPVNRHALRSEAARWGSLTSLLGATALDEQLRVALRGRHVRLRDLFPPWEAERRGFVSRREFCRALGLREDCEASASLFAALDREGTGFVSLEEMAARLRHAHRVTPPPSPAKLQLRRRPCSASCIDGVRRRAGGAAVSAAGKTGDGHESFCSSSDFSFRSSSSGHLVAREAPRLSLSRVMDLPTRPSPHLGASRSVGGSAGSVDAHCRQCPFERRERTSQVTCARTYGLTRSVSAPSAAHGRHGRGDHCSPTWKFSTARANKQSRSISSELAPVLHSLDESLRNLLRHKNMSTSLS